jgi:hypothetical protein
MSSAKVVVNKVGDSLQVVVSGYVGENAGLFDLNFTDIKKILIDVSGVNYINSVGVKNWITWLGRFPKNVQIIYQRCPSLIISQVNMVAGFLPNKGIIESLSAPFVCPDCNTESSVLLTLGTDYEYAKTPDGAYGFKRPKVLCAKCKTPMELDVMESKFFHFLTKVR